VQDILGNAFEEKQYTWKWQWKETQKDSDWQKTILTLCTSDPQNYGGWKSALTSNQPMWKTNPFHQLVQSAK